MAYKKKPKASKGEATPRLSKDSQAKKDLLERVRDRCKVMQDADSHNRSRAKDDLRFVNEPGAQWADNMKQERGDRPCLEANTLRINGKRLINEIRANRPQGHVRAVEGGDKEGAELREGLVRNILNISDFDTITDQAAEYQVDGGFGAWRVDTEYADDSMFDQDILVNSIKNPLDCLFWDPASEDLLLKRDAEDWALFKSMSTKAYEAKYGDAEQFDFENDGDSAEWEEEETVRVCEYWYKEPYDKELWLVELPKKDGSTNEDGTPVLERLTIDSTSDEAAALAQQPGFKPIKTREVRCHKIMMCVASGKSILEGPVEVGGAMFPFVVVFGEVKVIDGKVHWWGLHRFSKDAQQIQNIFWTAAAETVANAPKATTWASTAQAEGLLESWAEGHRKNFPTRLFNPDPTNPGPPQRHPGAEVPVAMLEMVGLAADLVRSTSGLHEASFGEESNEKSGIALARKQRQAQVVTYNFPDNMSKGAKRTGEIILDRIPIVYDAERELRILGVDGAEDYARVNQVVFDAKTGKTLRLNDLSSGKYDYYVKSGPSYSSMREEAAEAYGLIVEKFPEIMTVAGDVIFKVSDLPGSEEIAKRMQHLLLPAAQQAIADGKDLPPEVTAAQAQVKQAMKVVQEQTQLVRAAAQEVQQDAATSKAEKAGVDIAIAKLNEARAKFDADMEKTRSEFVKREADLAIRESRLDGAKQQLDGQAKQMQSEQQRAQETIDGGNADLSEAKKAVAEIDAMVAKFMEAAASAMAEIKTATAEIKARPKLKSVKLDRSNGETRAVPEFEEEAPTVQ